MNESLYDIHSGNGIKLSAEGVKELVEQRYDGENKEWLENIFDLSICDDIALEVVERFKADQGWDLETCINDKIDEYLQERDRCSCGNDMYHARVDRNGCYPRCGYCESFYYPNE